MLRKIKVGYPGETAFRPYKLKYTHTIAPTGCTPVRCYDYGNTTVCVSDEAKSGCTERVISFCSPQGHPLPDDVIGNILITLGMDPTRVINNYPGPYYPNPGRERTQYYSQPINLEAVV